MFVPVYEYKTRRVSKGLLLGAVLLLCMSIPAGFISPAAAQPEVRSAELSLEFANDILGRDISGNGQAIKPNDRAGSPLLVHVLAADGGPVAGIQVEFRIEPSYGARGHAFSNGHLEVSPKPGGETADALETIDHLVVTTDVLGYAQANFCGGDRVGIVAITARLVDNPSVTRRFSLQILNPRWSFLLWSGLLGGLSLFLLGMRMTSTGLEQAAGNRLRDILSRVTNKRILGLLTGIGVTALIQSSSATTVMVISFTNAGLMKLGQTLAIILGADVGTTLTVQLIAFSLKEYSLLIVFAGFIMSSLPMRRLRAPGKCLLGFGLIFFGMALMGDAMQPLRDHPVVARVLVGSAEHSVFVLLVATLFTGLIQSSAATIGIALTFAFQGLITLETAIPVILGANIGTCITAFLAALGARRDARLVAWAHILFKIVAVLVFLPFLEPFTELVRHTNGDLARQIANAHTIFNVSVAVLFLPFLGIAERWLQRLLPPEPESELVVWKPKYLDDRIMETPVLALAQVTREISRMGDVVLDMLRRSRNVIRDRDAQGRVEVKALDDKVDALDIALRRYLTRLSSVEMAPNDAAKVASLLYLVHHIETIGDLISKNLMEMARKLIQHDLRFSEAGNRQWLEFYDRNLELLEKALAAFATNDKVMAAEVVGAKDDMSIMARNLHFSHLGRLGQGIQETEQTSEIHIHLVSDLRRILSNTVSIAAAVVNEFRIPDLRAELRLGDDRRSDEPR